MKKILALMLLLVSTTTQAQIIDPGVTLQAEEGPFGYGGRGFIFRAEENFSMTSLGMDLRFEGTLDFTVSVYNVDGTSRGTLVSETAYPGMSDDNSEFFTLAHSQAFTAGNTYEVILRFADPGPIFPHYDFNNPTLNVANGFMAGTSMLVLDGSDFDSAGFNNTWLARFQINGEAGPPPVSTYTVGGTVSGLAASTSVTLQNNAGDDLEVSANGPFEFATALEDAAGYDVTVSQQPDGQRCTVGNGDGAIDGADVTDVTVTCANLPPPRPDIAVPVDNRLALAALILLMLFAARRGISARSRN